MRRVWDSSTDVLRVFCALFHTTKDSERIVVKWTSLEEFAEHTDPRFRLDPFTRHPPTPATRGPGLIFVDNTHEFPGLVNGHIARAPENSVDTRGKEES